MFVKENPDRKKKKEKGNMLQNQNNFSNKKNSFIPQINSNLTTPLTSDSDLK